MPRNLFAQALGCFSVDMQDAIFYDNYVSLGRTCEVAFQFRRVIGEHKAGFFNWNLTPVDALLSLLRSDFQGILLDENLSHLKDNLFLDSGHNYAVHADFSYPDLRSDGNYDIKIKRLREKTDYFLSIFRSLGDRGKTAFFYRTEEVDNIAQHMTNVRNLLCSYICKSKFDLVVAMPASNLDRPYDDGNIHFRKLARLAPGPDAQDGHVSSWDKIFAEFPHRVGLRLAGY
jgi:hypothetical protein